MNKILKAFALTAAVVMSFSVLTACGDKADTPLSSGDSTQNVPADNGENSDNPQSPADGDTVYAIPSLTIDGKSIDISDNPVIFTVGGVDIHFDEYRYVYLFYKNYYASANGITDEMWKDNEQNFEVIKNQVLSDLIEQNYGNIVAKKYGVSLANEDYDKVEDAMEEERAMFESEEAFQEALKESGIEEDLLRRMMTSGVMTERVYNDVYAAEDAILKHTDEEIKKDLKENYVRVYHLLISNDHLLGSEGYDGVTDTVLKEGAEKLVKEKLAEIKDGADLYELAQSIGDDPGMQENPDGYLFTYGQMVEPFEKAAFKLKVGEISDIVESDYGFHIIQRLEQDNYIEENFETVREQYINDFFNADVNKILEEAEITYSEYYDGITYNSIT